MSNRQGKLLLSPTAIDGMNITSANTTSFNLDVDVVVAERLWLELVLMKVQPGLWSVDLEPRKRLWVRHLEGIRKENSTAQRSNKHSTTDMKSLARGRKTHHHRANPTIY